MNKATISILTVLLLSVLISGCGEIDANTDDGDASAFPSDDQVIQDATPKNRKGLIGVEVVEGKHGESYLHPRDLVRYWDRGVVIKRQAKVHGAPDAVVLVGGLARYQKVGDQYKYVRFLTTYNSYEGIPQPNKDDLQRFVEDNLNEVFVSREDTITEISKIELDEERPWKWHTPNSFSVPFVIRYKEIASNTRVDERQDQMAIRFYRDSLDKPIHALMATEEDRQILASEEFSAEEISGMKTLRTAFK
jgi:hypothetical protein